MDLPPAKNVGAGDLIRVADLMILAARADTSVSKNRSPSPILSSLPDDAHHAKILRLLRVLHKLNAAEAQRPARPLDRRALAETAFINNKLTAKLTRQLEEPMIVVR
jgi:E3 ubiquitin-protein ligase TRIP12